jgi:hypothetical protein
MSNWFSGWIRPKPARYLGEVSGVTYTDNMQPPGHQYVQVQGEAVQVDPYVPPDLPNSWGTPPSLSPAWGPQPEPETWIVSTDTEIKLDGADGPVPVKREIPPVEKPKKRLIRLGS